MNSREERGREIAATSRLANRGGNWFVASQFSNRHYTVSLDAEPTCTCPDFESRGGKCKHIWAVEFFKQRKIEEGRRRPVPLRQPQLTREDKPSYPQNWAAYNVAQTHEKERFLILLHDLCMGVSEIKKPRNGRPRLPIQDAVFSVCYKIYSTVSGRRFMTDLREAQTKGYIAKTPHFNSIFNTLENPSLTPILLEMITESSLPLKSVEVDFAADSSGFTTSRFHRWFDHKYGAVRQEHDWVKCHLMCGVRTNIVTAVEIRERNASDTKLLPALVSATAKNFRLNEVSGDKAYSSLKNYKAIQYHGATPYIAFTGTQNGRAEGLWQRMYHMYQFNRAEFLAHYHKRSNVESTFSMIKAKFRDHVRSKTDVAMKNEVLCKIICHNICCLIHESQELGIDTTFWAESSSAQKQPFN